jgi:hypothetical protein
MRTRIVGGEGEAGLVQGLKHRASCQTGMTVVDARPTIVLALHKYLLAAIKKLCGLPM